MLQNIEDHICIEEPSETQKYCFKTMLAWADQQDFTPDTLHIDGTVEDQTGTKHDSPVRELPHEDDNQLLVLADHNGEFDRIIFSEKGHKTGRVLVDKLSEMCGIDLTELKNRHEIRRIEL